MKKVLVALISSVAIFAAACSSSSQNTAEQEVPPVVFAAASLNKILPEISSEAEYSFDGSSGLVDQLVGGAPADVFLSADKKNMDRAVSEGVIDGDPVMFATNYLVLVTPVDNPAGITGFDASLAGTKLVVCQVEVPCGQATARVAEKAGMTLTPVSEETKVTDVLGKVLSGEADAGLVYATDAAGKDVLTMEIPGASDDPNTYWAAVVKDGKNPVAAQEYIDKLTHQWQPQLAEAGFGAPVK